MRGINVNRKGRECKNQTNRNFGVYSHGVGKASDSRLPRIWFLPKHPAIRATSRLLDNKQQFEFYFQLRYRKKRLVEKPFRTQNLLVIEQRDRVVPLPMDDSLISFPNGYQIRWCLEKARHSWHMKLGVQLEVWRPNSIQAKFLV